VFENILEDAECLKTADMAIVDQILNDCVKAKLDDVRVGVIIRAMAKGTDLSITDMRASFKQLKKTGTSVKLEDYGAKICTMTLNRFFTSGGEVGNFLTRSISGHFWEYLGTHWVMRTDEQISTSVLEVIQDSIPPDAGPQAVLLNQAMTLLRASCSRKEDVFRFAGEPYPVINCRNAELWIQPDGSVHPRPHNPRSYLTYCLDYDYDDEATCPLYDQTLEEIFALSPNPAALARHWNEFFGYSIQPVRNIPSFWMLFGRGSNGKSKLVETIERLVGRQSIASVKVDSLERQFGLSALLGKLIMIDDDVDENTKLPDGVLKKISERKSVSVEFKGKTAFDATMTVVPIMLCNNYPRTGDLSHGLRRRAHAFLFARQFDGPDDDKTRFDRIWHSEMPGILNRAIQGLQRLRRRGHFDVPQSCKDAVEEWLNEANPVRSFIGEMMRPNSTATALTLKVIYEALQVWGMKTGVRNLPTRTKMGASLEALGFTKGRTHGMQTMPGYEFTDEMQKMLDDYYRHRDAYKGPQSRLDYFPETT